MDNITIVFKKVCYFLPEDNPMLYIYIQYISHPVFCWLSPNCSLVKATWTAGTFSFIDDFPSKKLKKPSWSIHWPSQEAIYWRYLPYIRPIFEGLISGNIPTKYGLIWYSTSILGSWNSHWFILDFPASNVWLPEGEPVEIPIIYSWWLMLDSDYP